MLEQMIRIGCIVCSISRASCVKTRTIHWGRHSPKKKTVEVVIVPKSAVRKNVRNIR